MLKKGDDMEPIRLLIVEDDKITLDYLARMDVWRQLGIEVAATAINGKQGLVKYRAYRPNLVLSDVEMPFLNGLEMFREIHRDNSQVILLVISSYSEFSYVKEAMQLGAWAYLLKNELSEEAVLGVLTPVVNRIRELLQTAESAISRELQTLRLEEPVEYSQTAAVLERSFRILRTHGGAETAARLRDQANRSLKKAWRVLGKAESFMPCQEKNLDPLEQWILIQIRLLLDQKQSARIQASPTVANSVAYIQQNYADRNLSIEQIAQHVFVSPNWLSAKFKSEIGCTINEYITQYRIDKAKNLLIQGKYKIYEVADMVGYGSSRYFSRVFSRLTNQTPQNYRGD